MWLVWIFRRFSQDRSAPVGGTRTRSDPATGITTSVVADRVASSRTQALTVAAFMKGCAITATRNILAI